MFHLFIFPFLFLAVHGAGELSIIQTPESIQFKGQEPLDLSSVKSIFSTAFGFTIPQSRRWSGMVVRDPFNFAEAVVVIAVPGVASLDLGQGSIYQLNTDENLENTFHFLSYQMSDRFPTMENLTINFVNLEEPATVQEYYGILSERDSPNVEYLKPDAPADKAFIDQINTLDALTSKIAETGIVTDGLPDLHWIKVPGLHGLVDTYGSDSKQVQEAKRLLSTSVLLLSEVFSSNYEDKALFAVVSSDVVHTRRYRRQTNTGEQGYQTSDDDFPAIFNIFLWFTVAFFFVLLACSVGIAKMDPGRDSIIYRMTSNRMKKEN